MALLAEIDLAPGGVLAWVIVGLLSGFLAGKVMRGEGYGLIGDLVVGLIGAFVGGLLSGMFLNASYGFVGSIVVAFLGACLLIGILRFFASRRSYS